MARNTHCEICKNPIERQGFATDRVAFESTHPFDILAMKGDRQIRVEVKTEILLPSGYAFVSMKKGQAAKHDVLAKVRSLGEVITYQPDIGV